MNEEVTTMRKAQGAAEGSSAIGDMNGPVMYWGPVQRPLSELAPAACTCGAAMREPSTMAKVEVKVAA
jgi:hypothetical protein